MSPELARSDDTLPFPDRRQVPRRQVDRRLLQRDRELEATRSICEALSQHVYVDKLVKQALCTALEVVGAEAGSVLLADPDSKQLVFRHVIGEKAGVLLRTGMPWDQGLAGAVFSSGKTQVIADVKHDRRHFPYIDELTNYQTRDMIVAPLKRWEGDPIGVLEILNKRDGQLGENDIAILSIISALTAMMIEQAHLLEEAKLAEVVRLLGDIGHDLKNLLQPVVSGTWLLKGELAEVFSSLSKLDAVKAAVSEGMCDEFIKMIQKTCDRIHHRVKEIADCVKGLSSPPQFGPCKVADVVDEVLQTLRVLAEEKKVALQTEGLDLVPSILADDRRLYNAFYNLVNNAIPEVPEGGSIRVSGRSNPEAGVIFISITDSGKGMPPEVRDSLFSARAISRKVGGTGLGTKIVKDVVDAHGGDITVVSKEGVGTTFCIRLPLCPPGASAA